MQKLEESIVLRMTVSHVDGLVMSENGILLQCPRRQKIEWSTIPHAPGSTCVTAESTVARHILGQTTRQETSFATAHTLRVSLPV